MIRVLAALERLGLEITTSNPQALVAAAISAGSRCGAVVQWLIRQGVDVNEPDAAGSSPLRLALRERHSTQTLVALIAAGADVMEPGSWKRRLLDELPGEVRRELNAALPGWSQ